MTANLCDGPLADCRHPAFAKNNCMEVSSEKKISNETNIRKLSERSNLKIAKDSFIMSADVYSYIWEMHPVSDIISVIEQSFNDLETC